MKGKTTNGNRAKKKGAPRKIAKSEEIVGYKVKKLRNREIRKEKNGKLYKATDKRCGNTQSV